MRVGLFGGTFDPPHLGHLLIAQEAYEQAALDRVVFMPALAPPHKRERVVSPFAVRLAMVEEAIRGDPRFGVSDLEAHLPAPSYTVDTLRELRARAPSWERIDLIIGSDSLLELPTWRSPEEVVRLAGLVVYPREGSPVTAAPCEFARHARVLDVPELPISSTWVRCRVMAGRGVRYWVPEGVRALIELHGLYRTPAEA